MEVPSTDSPARAASSRASLMYAFEMSWIRRTYFPTRIEHSARAACSASLRSWSESAAMILLSSRSECGKAHKARALRGDAGESYADVGSRDISRGLFHAISGRAHSL